MVRKTIDMSRLDKLKIDGEAANYLVQWDNTLLLTAYDQNRMFVLTIDGERLLIRERLKDVLSRFAQANLIYRLAPEWLKTISRNQAVSLEISFLDTKLLLN